MKYIVSFCNGICDDIISFDVVAFSDFEALNKILNKNPEYSGWKYFVHLN